MRNLKLAIVGLILLSAGLLSCTRGPEAKACTVTPEYFCEPFDSLRQKMPESDKEILMNTPEKDLGKYHLSIGMAVRNDLGLWKDNQITQFFKQRGAEHPDMMSYIVLIALSKSLNGQNVDMNEVTKHVVVDLRPPPPPPPPSGQSG